jgi:hypothetical protein
MTALSRRRVAATLVAAYILTGVLSGLFHRHDFALLLQGAPGITSHTCGDHERHIPLDRISACPQCVQSTHRFLPLSAVLLPASLPVLSSPPRTADAFHPHPAYTLLPDKRGPPGRS